VSEPLQAPPAPPGAGRPIVGDDGIARCGWCYGSSDYIDYHDNEWGRAVVGDDAVFERMLLEGFQSGLSWLTILRKRPAFRVAFAGFSIEAVARFTDKDVDRLLGDAGIVRNRAKILAAIANAHAAIELAASGTSLVELVESFVPRKKPPTPGPRHAVPASTPESVAMAKELKRLGFKFIGPTTAYAHMQATGLVNDHLAGCAIRAQCPRG
jgi:DNA-3-methyladenine glycosylase I